MKRHLTIVKPTNIIFLTERKKRKIESECVSLRITNHWRIFRGFCGSVYHYAANDDR